MRTCTRILFSLAAATLGIPCPAAILRVDSTAPGPTHDGLSWPTAFLKIQDAVNASHTGDEAWVAAGVYHETVQIPATASVSLYGGFAGTETDRSQRTLGPESTSIDAAREGTVVLVEAPDVTVDGLTIRNGGALNRTWKGSVTACLGSGIFCEGDRCVLSGNIIEGNQSCAIYGIEDYEGNGAGIACPGNGVRIRGNVITGNTAYGSSVYWPTEPGPYLGQGAVGAGVYVSGADAVLEANLIQGNVIYFWRDNDPPQMEQRASSASGAGIFAIGPRAVIRRNVIAYNSATAYDLSRPGSHGYEATGHASGGGVYAYGARIEDNLIVHNTVYGNGYSNGGAVYMRTPCTLINNTIADNSAADGGGVGASYEGGGTLTNNIIAFNEGAMALTGIVTSHNDVFGETYAPGATDIVQDPLFANREGGDYRLQIGSPCVDAGEDAAVAPGDFDLRGVARKIGDHVDIGCYESARPSQPAALVARALQVEGGVSSVHGDMGALDVSGDGLVTVVDAVRLIRKAVGLEAASTARRG